MFSILLWGILLINCLKFFQEVHYHYKEYLVYVFLVYFKKMIIIFLLIMLLEINTYILIIIEMYSCFFIYKNIQRKHINSLKYTKRIIRLLITIILLECLIVLGYLQVFGIDIKCFLINIFLIPLIVILADIINFPIEQLIRRHYYKLAKQKINQFKPFIIGITGSCGKTSVKNYLYQILKEYEIAYQSDKSYNTLNGLSLTINQRLNKENTYLILEMGASHKGDIQKIVNVIKPNIAIITEILPQHLKTFKKFSNIVDEKFKIVDQLQEPKILIANFDNQYIKTRCENLGIKVISYGTTYPCQLRATNIDCQMDKTSFTLIVNNQEYAINTKLVGYHNVSNMLAVIAVLLALNNNINNNNININNIIHEASLIENVSNRLQVIKKDNLTIINDSYNSNIQGFINALEILALSKTIKFIITPGIVEGGSLGKSINQRIAEKIIKIVDFALIVRNKDSLIYEKIFQKNDFWNYKIVDSFKDGYELVLEEIKTQEITVLIENDLTDNYFI